MADSLKPAGYGGGDPGGGFIDGVSIDTRTGCSGALFVALNGEHDDGHVFLRDAVGKGAAALLVAQERLSDAREAAGDLPVFGVRDTLAGLQALAAAYRDRVSPRVVAITGSTGKTGTKDIIASIVACRFRVHATPGNLNNHIGLPLTMLGMEGMEEILVAELGANHPKEIERLAELARPEVGVVTNIGPVHLEYFDSLEKVASAKAELLLSLPAGGFAVLPADDEFLGFLAERTKAEVVTFGYSDSADWRIEGVEMIEGGGYRFKLGSIEFELARYGRHNILNAAAAAVVGSLLGLRGEEISEGIGRSKLAEGRGVLYDLDGILLMDDTYNSNPASLKAAVEAFMEIPVTGRRWLVLGDMLELGDRSSELHAEAGVYCGKAGVDGIVTLGEESVELSRSAAVQRKAPPHLSHFIDDEKAASFVNGYLRGGDALLVKGSRGMHMERFIKTIEELRGKIRRRSD